jgi:hypothetical protein
LDTDKLIERLAADAAPVRRLRPPGRRLALWLALSVPYVALVAYIHGLVVDLPSLGADPRFVIEATAALATAIAAGYAAFSTLVPGRGRAVVWLPLIPLSVWLVSIGKGCIDDWVRLGAAGLTVKIDWMCIPPLAWIGIVPAIAMVVMLRRGAPLMPRVTVALGGLAIGALANAGLQLFHLGDISVMVLVWHFGTTVLLSALAGWVGPGIFRWNVAPQSSGA